MALLDFSDVILDPDLSGTFSVERRSESIDPANGRAITTTETIDGLVGVLTFSGGAQTRRDDGAFTGRVLSVITRFRLRSVADAVQADVVLYDGSRFTVKAVDPWHRFGSGFVSAQAELMQASTPPVE